MQISDSLLREMTYSVREPITPEVDAELSHLEPFLRRLLFLRGIKTREGAERFLNPNYDLHTHDPFLLSGMESAVSRIISALRENERIAVYSDYDADGIPGGVILHDFFTRIGFSNFENYIPSRHDEGFGLNFEAVQNLKDSGTRLIITVDCGITDISEVDFSNELGMDVIITDHHEAGEKLPKAVSIVNPKQPGCGYPEAVLCGAGVAFKLVQALILRLKNYELSNLKIDQLTPGWEKWLLDMAGLATLSDMVPLQGENRVIAHYGLLVLRKSPRPGIMQLLQKLKIRQKFLSEDDIGFMIAPRINAASRMGEARDAFSLLSSKSVEEVGSSVDKLDHVNNERKGIVASLVKEARKILKERFGENIGRAIVLGNPDWRPSLLGLVASALVDSFHVPVFLWGRSGNDAIKGSCRAPLGYSVVSIMSRLPEGTLSDFGGHDQSGGFTVSSDAVHFFPERIEEVVASMPISMKPPHIVDSVMSVDDINSSLISSIKKCAPFGVGNPKPLFLFKQSQVKEVSFFGKEKNHVKLSLARKGRPLEAICFFGHHLPWVPSLSANSLVDIIGVVEESSFRGFPEIRIRIIDIIIS